jgi:Ser/Thr protein kinase RdoA (MazF antagonist)
MAQTDNSFKQTAFSSITPELVLTTVEKALNVQCSNICRPLNSYINRVYELQRVDGQGLIVKFYRPGRWSKAALLDEHQYLLELMAAEIPVVAPLEHVNHSTLGEVGNIYFAVFPKKGGRSYDEYTEEQWLELGRLLGRTHAVGAKHSAKDRIIMSPKQATRAQLDYILAGKFMQPDLIGQFKEVTDAIINEISPLFADIEMIRIHGDCHFSNLIYRPGESFLVIDFDDMAMGVPVQDFWMLLPGYREDSVVEINHFLEGYEMFREFDWRTLGLIEPLRAMRYIHYMVWCAHQVAEDGLSRVVPDFGTAGYWQREINDLAEQLQRIRSAPKLFSGNFL